LSELQKIKSQSFNLEIKVNKHNQVEEIIPPAGVTWSQSGVDDPELQRGQDVALTTSMAAMPSSMTTGYHAVGLGPPGRKGGAADSL
jgi:hypothetical protein